MIVEAKNQGNRNKILKSLKRAFPKIHKASPNNELFIKNSQKWFNDHADQLKVISDEKYGIEFISMDADEAIIIEKYRKMNLGLFVLLANRPKNNPQK